MHFIVQLFACDSLVELIRKKKKTDYLPPPQKNPKKLKNLT